MIGRLLVFAPICLAGAGIGFFLAMREDPSSANEPDSSKASQMEGQRPSLVPAKGKPGATRKDRVRRLKKAVTIKNDGERQRVVTELFHEWCREDPAEAFEAWAATPHLRVSNVEYAIMDSLVPVIGFEKTVGKVVEMKKPDLARTRAFQALGRAVFNASDKPSAVESLFAALASDEQSMVLPTAIRSWRITEGFETVVDWIDSHSDEFDPDTLGYLDRAAASQLIQKDPDRAISFLTERATEETLPFHLQEIASQWSAIAPNATGKWLATLPEGPQNDYALFVYAQAVVEDDPESAASWAETITAGDVRHKALEIVMSNWRRIDPAGAAAFKQGGETVR